MRASEYLYYKVNDLITFNKLTAVEHARGDLSKVKFYFADDTHALYDWTKEPQESFEDLMDQRVREIRDQYDYVALWYSGGYDSQTILDSFIRTNTKLDELLMYGRQWYEHEYNCEEKIAYKHAQTFKQRYQPGVKLRVLYYDHDSLFDFYKTQGLDWIYKEPGHFPTITKQNRANTAHYQKEFRDINNQRGRIDINGIDKSRVNLRDGKWYAQMPDQAINYYFDCNYDLFYISPEATKLYIKQCWLVIKWFESRPECSHEFVHHVQGNFDNGDLYAQWNRAQGRTPVYDLQSAYGLHKQLVGYSVNSVEGRKLRDSTKTQNTEIYNIWKSGIDYMENKFKDIWTPNRGLKTILSQPIYIKDFEHQPQQILGKEIIQ
jgi:hypothetical protein